MKKDAILSECGLHRYQLSRIWDENKPQVLFIMLNPSKADASNDDPTIRRCINFAKSWGYGGLQVCNLFAYRATKPSELLKSDNPFGDENIWHIRQAVDKVNLIVCAWGNSGIVKKILKKESPYRLIGFATKRLSYLKLSKDGTPWHPLYVKGDVIPTSFSS